MRELTGKTWLCCISLWALLSDGFKKRTFFKNEMKLFLRKWHRWKWNFMRWTKKHVFSVNLIGLFLKKERICGKFVLCFYFNLRTLYRTKTHSLSITRLNVEQVKCYCSKAIIQQTSHKTFFSEKKNNTITSSYRCMSAH